ncbi:MAG: Rv3235 family protein [Promicromonosporaceae bacterium]|nr:Rv3235 family protein [Promicromonosporaceae bacterium]
MNPRLVVTTPPQPGPPLPLTWEAPRRTGPRSARPLPTRPVEAAALPDPTRLCCSLVKAALEVITGTRQLSQLNAWLLPAALQQVAARAEHARLEGRDLLRQAPGPVRVRRVRCEPEARHAEATVIIEQGERLRAVAVRLVAVRDQWRVGVLQIG